MNAAGADSGGVQIERDESVFRDQLSGGVEVSLSDMQLLRENV